MKRIALISNWQEACGLAEYCGNLFRKLEDSGYEVEVMRYCPVGDGYDVVVINYHPAIIGFTVDDVKRMQQHGAKVILLLQESYPRHHVASVQDAMDVVDAVVAHEQMEISHYQVKQVNFRYIQHGLPDVEVPDYVMGEYPVFGTCGFAFPAKRMEVTVRAALATNGNALLIAPPHSSYNPHELYQQWQRMGAPKVVVRSDFMSQEEVLKLLATCTATIYFAVEPNGPGQSGTARMMTASRRPAIIRRCSKTKTLFEYEDEVYFVNTEEEVLRTASEIWKALKAGQPVKTPKRLVEDLSWKTTGKLFSNLIEELTAKEVLA